MILQEFIQYLKPPFSPKNILGILIPYDRGTIRIYRNKIDLTIHSISPVIGETQRGQK